MLICSFAEMRYRYLWGCALGAQHCDAEVIMQVNTFAFC